jgi:hypothetical protein
MIVALLAAILVVLVLANQKTPPAPSRHGAVAHGTPARRPPRGLSRLGGGVGEAGVARCPRGRGGCCWCSRRWPEARASSRREPRGSPCGDAPPVKRGAPALEHWPARVGRPGVLGYGRRPLRRLAAPPASPGSHRGTVRGVPPRGAGGVAGERAHFGGFAVPLQITHPIVGSLASARPTALAHDRLGSPSPEHSTPSRGCPSGAPTLFQVARTY